MRPCVARGRTGKGQLVSTSLYRQGAYTVSFDLNTFLMTGHSIAIGQRETMGNPCMNNYTAGDGRRIWIVGLQGDRHWPALCRAVERPEWLTDSRFAKRDPAPPTQQNSSVSSTRSSRPNRWTNGRKSLRQSRISSGRRSTHRGRSGRRAIPRCGRHGAGTGGRRQRPDGRHTADPHGTPWEPRSPAPRLGQHTEEVLADRALRRP